PDSGGPDPDDLTAVNGTLFFVADDPTNAFELWKSDGTAEGTVLVKDFDPPGGADSLPFGLTNVNGDALLPRLRSGERHRALEERRDGGGDGARQGHQPG